MWGLSSSFGRSDLHDLSILTSSSHKVHSRVPCSWPRLLILLPTLTKVNLHALMMNITSFISIFLFASHLAARSTLPRLRMRAKAW